MKGFEVVGRARSQLGLGTIYTLGKGGFMPKRETAHDSQKRLDCSGFSSWCLGVSRKTDNPWYKDVNGGWFETSAIVRDCRSPFGVFDFASIAMPGMLIVFGDKAGRQGHIGVVSEVHGGGVHRVIHCSSGNFKEFGDAIQETTPDIFFANGAVLARCAWVEHEG